MESQTSFIFRQRDNNETVHHGIVNKCCYHLEVEEGLGRGHAPADPGDGGPALPPLLPDNKCVISQLALGSVLEKVQSSNPIQSL